MTLFADHRAAAKALLNSGHQFRPRIGRFLGGLLYLPNPMDDRQTSLLADLLKECGLPKWEGAE